MRELFNGFFYGEGFTMGDYSYGFIHLCFVFGIIVFVLYVSNNYKTEQSRKKIIRTIAIFQITFEILWRVITISLYGFNLFYLYPFYPCNLNGIIVPIVALYGNKKQKDLFYLFAVIGAIVTFSYPQGIFNFDILTFGILKSMLQHTGIFIIPILEYVFRFYKPKFKNTIYVFIGTFIHVGNSVLIPYLLGMQNTDYMFFNSGLPFTINGVPGFITLSIFAAIILVLVSYFTDIELVKSNFSKILKKKTKYA